MNAYTLGDAARICGVSRQRLRYWERTALVRASVRKDSQPAFDFRALVTVRSILGLLARGVPLHRIRRSVEAVRERIPELEPLPVLRLWEGSARFVIRHEGVLMEPDGQLVLDLDGAAGGAGVARLVGGGTATQGARMHRGAVEWFERGCELDCERATYAEAAEAYRKAIELDPEYADAHCNLGSVYFNQDRRGMARESFERALEIEPDHVEANLNLGAVLEEQGRDESALRRYRIALEADPMYPDVHVSLALLYEKLALPRTAQAHWRRYLHLAPQGAWSDVARRRLHAE
ncbi:MAG: tetratricopeptide repeat protein [Myxococcales bacterium]|nr:tetratricopeptide repeat protein [Myxococcales bacterium]MDH5307689.1 tetratricopeptide repeat protein [Myxococcales bacterium]